MGSIGVREYIGLDQIGKTGLATKVNHGYLQAFAAAVTSGLGGLAGKRFLRRDSERGREPRFDSPAGYRNSTKI
jgi:hypothetical protein